MPCKSLFAITLCLFALPALADVPVAQLPYTQLLGYQQRVDDLQDLKQLKVWENVKSSRHGVRPSDITLTIMRDASHGGPLAIAVDEAGNFTLPVTQALKDEDAMVVSNQPKGTLELSVNWEIGLPASTRLRYGQLLLGAQQYNEAMRRQGVMDSTLAPKATGLLLAYPDGGHRVTLHTAAGDKVIAAKSYKELGDAVKGIDMSGMPVTTTLIYLPLDKALLKEDPAVTLDAMPEAISASYH